MWKVPGKVHTHRKATKFPAPMAGPGQLPEDTMGSTADAWPMMRPQAPQRESGNKCGEVNCSIFYLFVSI